MQDRDRGPHERSLREAERFLRRHDVVLAEIIRRVGPCQLQPGRDGFATLVGAVIGQQLSSATAAAIQTRVRKLFGGSGDIWPEDIQRTPANDLREAGVSAQKAECIRAIANQVIQGTLNLGRFGDMKDDEVVAALTEVKGVGPWTAEMYLIFSLNRPDVFPIHDAAVARAVREAYRLASGDDEAIQRISAVWAPHRSVASWYMYRYLDIPS